MLVYSIEGKTRQQMQLGCFKERGIGKGFSRELIRWNGYVLRMHKDGVTEKENSQKVGRYQGGNSRFGKCHIEWRNNIGG
jgi:hypothetical protein